MSSLIEPPMTELKHLLGITYSEFDKIVGPQLQFAYPNDVIHPKTFENISDFAIVDRQLCDKIIIVKVNDIQYLSYTITIDNSKYFRNNLLFSCGFVLDKHCLNTKPYELVLRKLAHSFRDAEIENELLYNPINKLKLADILHDIYDQLSTKNEAMVCIDESNICCLKLQLLPTSSLEVREYHVPMLLYDK